MEEPAQETCLSATLVEGLVATSTALAAPATASDGAAIAPAVSPGATDAFQKKPSDAPNMDEPSLRQGPALSTGLDCWDRDTEAGTAMPGDCRENTSRDESRCAHIHIYRIRVGTINVRQDGINERRDQDKTFAMWLMDEEHLEDHLMFVASVILNVSLVMVLTFAWLEADLELAGLPWLLAGLAAILLAVQSCTWMSLALYSLWLYPKAYFNWKTESRSSLGSRRRHRQSRRFLRNRGRNRTSNRTGTPSPPVVDADEPNGNAIQTAVGTETRSS